MRRLIAQLRNGFFRSAWGCGLDADLRVLGNSCRLPVTIRPLMRSVRRETGECVSGPLNGPTLLPLLDCPLHLTTGFTGFDRFPTIILLLALGKAKLDLGLATFGEVDAKRHKRQPFLLRLAEQLIDLLFMEQQLAGSERVMVHQIAMAIGADMAMIEEDFAVFHTCIAVLHKTAMQV